MNTTKTKEQYQMEFISITGERSRTYVFNDSRFTVSNVTRLCVRPSGTHRLETADGKKFIVRSGWVAIEVDAEQWSA